MASKTPAGPPARPRVTGALRVNWQTPYPWPRAISAGLSAALPILLGIWLGHLSYGLLAAIGGFAYLYTSNEPYSRRAVKLLTVMVSFALCYAAGSLSATASIWWAALVLGLVSAGAVFLCDALDVAPPSALFFVYLCAIGTSTPAGAPSAFLFRVLLIFLGGIPGWLISMSGWLFDPHGPETRAVTNTYRALALCLATVGTPEFPAAQHRAALALRSSEKVLSASSIPRRRPGSFYRLLRLNQQADAVFLAVIAYSAETGDPLDPKLAAAVRALADAVGDPDRAASLALPKRACTTAATHKMYQELLATVTTAADETTEPVQGFRSTPTSLRAALAGALNPTSLIVPRSLRFGLILLIAFLVAYGVRAQRPYWAFVSTAAVMMGPTVTATVHRAIQRTAGTVSGALVAALILHLQPSPTWMALAIALMQALSSLMGVRNYALTVTFYTPLGLLIAHGGHPEFSTRYLVTARVIDIFLGSALGLVGTLLLDRGSASRRLPLVLRDALRGEGRLVETLSAAQGGGTDVERNRLRAALLNLRVVYDKAANELTHGGARVELLWPAVIAVQRLGFFLIAVTAEDRRVRISQESLAQLQEVFGGLAKAVEAGRAPRVDCTPVIPEYPVIGQELGEIGEALQVLELSPS